MRKQVVLLPLFFVFSLVSCSDLNLAIPAEATNRVIKSGQSFGMCVGPCYEEVIYSGSKGQFVVRETPFRGGNGPATTFTTDFVLSQNQMNELYQLVDFKSFVTIDTLLGCPDCADGGKEWIEITDGNKRHRVTFEYGDDLPGQEKLLDLLRKERQTLRKQFEASGK